MRAAAITISLISACAGFSVPASSQTLPSPAVLLTNAEQVRDAAPAETGKALPVWFSGVVIDKADPGQQAVILLDGNTGIYVAPKNNATMFDSYRRGDLLEIHGITDPGQFAPIVVADAVKKLGTAKIPPAQPVTYQQLITGSLDAQWVEISGVVRQCYTNPADPQSDIQTIIVASDAGLVPVGMVKGSSQQIQVDSEVRVRAVSLYLFDQKRQAVTPVLHVPQGEPVVVEKAAPKDPFDTPLRSTASLLMFSPDNLYGYAHRVHVQGTVTCCQPGAFVWIRDGNMGLSIQTTQPESLQPGDKIDVLGFPTFGSYPPALKDSTIRKIGYTEPLPPLALTNFNAAFDHENDLVAVDGTLTQIQPVLNGIALTLDKDGQLFKAFLKTPAGESSYSDWQVGSKVTVIGICSVAYDDTVPLPGIWQPKSFQIVLRSPSDLVVLTRPSWWTLGHIAMLLGIVTCILVLMMGLVMFLSRRRLQEQERQRQMAEAEFAAILSERNRMAREIHDTLAQGLAATSVQLRLAKKFLNGASEAAAEHLDTAQQLVRDSLEESRDSIWNMRSHVLENNDLADALQQILKQMAGGTEIKTHFAVIGCSRRLAPVVENNILRIGQEAIANATKHSGARDINVTLEFLEKQFRLKVTDNGCGFDPNNPPFTNGGFGLIGMRERAAELNGQLDVRSSPGRGSDVTLDAPLSKS
jgi:signal transduction histidine kinase